MTECFENRRELEELARAAEGEDEVLRRPSTRRTTRSSWSSLSKTSRVRPSGFGHVLVNTAACRYTGLPEEELLGSDVLTLVRLWT